MSRDETAAAGIGVALMAIASISVSIVDGTAKYLSRDYSPYLIAWARYAVAFCVVLPIGMARFGRHMFPDRDLGAHTARTACMVTGMTLFFASLQTTDLASAIVAFFVGPVIAIPLAFVILGERPTPTNLASFAVGFSGVIIAVGPTQMPSKGIVLALAAGVFLSVYLVTTRLAGRGSHPLKTLLFQCACGTLLLLPVAVGTFEIPTQPHVKLFLMMGVISALVHLMVIRAFQMAPATTLAPLIYLELVGAILVGIIVFGDFPGKTTLLGAVLIGTSGLLAWRSTLRHDNR
jgi:drug/metabolite transporter (DMT)-like permease